MFASRLATIAGSAGNSPIATASRSRRSGRPTRSSRAARAASTTSRLSSLGSAAARLADGPDAASGRRRDPSGRAASPSRPTAPRPRLGPRCPPRCWSLPELALAPRRRRDLLTLQRDRRRRRDAARDPRRSGAGWRSLRERAAADARPAPDRRARDRQRPAAAPLRGRGRARPSSASAPGELDKVVLAREVVGRGAGARTTRPRCSAPCGSSSRPASASASARRRPRSSAPARSCWSAARGAGAATVALAGSTRRSADPAVDDHLGEQLLQQRQGPVRARDRRPADRAQARPLGRSGSRPSAEPERDQGGEHPAPGDADPRAARRAALGHRARRAPAPDPGRRRRAATPRRRRLIAELEDIDRGWYAGPVGWMDAAEDGEFCVALRSALLRDRTAHLFAGGGHRRRLGPGRRARRDRAQARGAAAAARRLAQALHRIARPPAARRRRCGGAGRRSPRRSTGTSTRPVPAASAGRSWSSLSTRWWPIPKSAATRREGQRPRGREQGLELVRGRAARPAAGSSKMPPPPLSTTTILTGVETCASAARPPRSCRRPRSPVTITVGRPLAAAAPIPDETSPSMPFAPRLARKSTSASPPDRKASWSRIGMLDAGVDEVAVLVEPRRAPAAGRARSAPRAASSPASIASRAPASAVEPGSRPARVRRRRRPTRPATAAASAPAGARTIAPAIRLGSFQPCRGSTTSWCSAVELGQPGAQRLAGRQLAEAQRRGRGAGHPAARGRSARRPRSTSAAVVGAEAQLRGGLGQDRKAGRAREAGDRLARPRVGQPAGDDHAARRAARRARRPRRRARAPAVPGAGGTVVSGRPSARPSQASGAVAVTSPSARLGPERVAPGDVQVHRPGPRVAGVRSRRRGRRPIGSAGGRRRPRRGCRPRRTSAPRTRRG